MLAGEKTPMQMMLVKLFAVIPLLALAAAVPVAWGWGLDWVDIGLAAFFYTLTCLGVTVGFHRYFTHGAFTANRPLRIALAAIGSMAMQGPIIGWVADRDILRVNRLFPLLTVVTLLAPALAGGLITWSWWGALTAFFWASLVRVAVLHHVTWSVNSICHMIGARPYTARDKSANFWPLAIASMGESWHNSHHADPTCARHGVGRGQIDVSARVIWIFERFGWVTKVRWPRAERFARKLRGTATA
ncbi:acyl-CoA desaturase [Kibdelosporangium aridum]|uniref:acyl-CoA desaturase n=1 Tax=Kibdelosporangium aridum TaxID=2030 RepID=UPI0035EACDC8